MFLVSVIPFASSLPSEELSYFTKEKLDRGTLVKVPIRKKSVFAVVQTCTALKDAKASIRRAPFEIKKVDQVVAKDFFTDNFINAINLTASEYALPLSQVFEAFVSKKLLETCVSCPSVKTRKNKTRAGSTRTAIEAPLQSRLNLYKASIEAFFQKGASVFLLVPDMATGENIQKHFSEMFPETRFFHSSLSQKKFDQELQSIAHTKSPSLVIATPLFLSLPLGNIGLIILEEENKETYRRIKRPYIDTRIFSEHFAKSSCVPLILGSSLLRTETMLDIEKSSTTRSVSSEKSIALPKKVDLIDMKKYRKDEDGFQVFGANSLRALKKATLQNKKIFLYTVRKGIAGVTLCRDCGTMIYCPTCTTPLVLENSSKGRKFTCRKCGHRERADSKEKILCTNCGGFRLEAFGIGTEKVEEVVRLLFPDVPVFRIDSNQTKTHRRAQKTADKWHGASQETAAILIGTEMSLKYLEGGADLSIIVSLDSLFAIPNFRMNVKIFSILTLIAENTKRALYIQTRDPGAEILSLFLAGDKLAFHKSDKNERKEYGFPPFFKFIKITAALKTKQEKKQQGKIEAFFGGYNPLVYPGFTERVKNREVIHTLLTLPSGVPLPEDLKKRLTALPFSYEIRIDPESIL